MIYKNILYRFRQDLRTEDNTWLRHAVHDGQQVWPIFIYDPSILDTFPKPDQRLVFVVAALEQLEKELATKWLGLDVYFWSPQELIPKITKERACEAIYLNASYGEKNLTRDATIRQRAKTENIVFRGRDDYLLVEPDRVPARKVFTPFFKLRQQVEKRQSLWVLPAVSNIISVKSRQVASSHTSNTSSRHPTSISYIKSYLRDHGYLPKNDKYLELRPVDGRKKRGETFDRDAYEETRNFPAQDGSTKLSPYVRFWLVSPRQIYRLLAQRKSNGAACIISELAWREFWYHIAYHFPYARQLEFQEKRRGLAWENNTEHFDARKEGKTWYPIVDAWMRQLLQEWWMHNRVRMIVASFLTKDLRIDRRRGERHFANYLLDYDAQVNAWNRQRSASVWADPKPLRIFSPLLQSKRFDPDAIYIKRYCPELVWSSLTAIHDATCGTPIVQHAVAARLAKTMYLGK